MRGYGPSFAKVRGIVMLSFVFAGSMAYAAEAEVESPRIVTSLDADWRFALGEQLGAEAAPFDDTQWRRLDLPHDYSIEGEYRKENPSRGACAYLPGGIGWYRRVIDVPPEWAGKHVAVEFDAAARNSKVWINGHLLGERPYAYISFAYEIGKYLQPGRNVLAVRLDTTRMPASRWYTGSGLYSHVRLVTADSVHVPQWGTFVSTPQVTDEAAEIALRVNVANDDNTSADVRVATDIVDEAGKPVASISIEGRIAGTTTTELVQSVRIAQPQLWSPETPRLYSAITRIFREGVLADRYVTVFGIRTMRWDADTGFWLNGHNIKLQGMGMHYDAGGLGMAIPDAVLEQRLKLLKAMGTNAIRTGHTPFPPLFYDLCDRLGIMVMNEAFDGWRRKALHDYGAHDFDEWWERDLTDFVRRDRNHPSVILWSIGNETGHSDKYNMTGLIRAFDPTRKVTGGQVLHGVDVSGFNGPGETPGVLEKFHEEHPEQPIVLTEEPHGYQTRGFYRTRTWWRDNNPESRYTFPSYGPEEVFKYGGDPQYCSSYDNATVRITNRQCWKRTRDTPWISGQFRWVAFDYLGEGHTGGRHWPARFWHPGIIDVAGFPKDIYYFYQGQWTSKPMVHVLPHWSHPLVARGTVVPVVAYSNCDEVELLLNGRSLGRQKQSELLEFVWKVPYEPGELKATGYRGGRAEATKVVRTAGAASRIELVSGRPELKAGRGEVASVAVAIRDERGELVPGANSRIDFALRGPAKVLGYENGNPTDVNGHRLGYRNAFAGLLRGYFGATDEGGPVELVAAGALGETPFQESTTVTLAVESVALRGQQGSRKYEIRYTMDGSEPTKNSRLYDLPLTLTTGSTVRMLVLRDGEPLIRSEGAFEKGQPPVYDDPRYERVTTGTADFPAGPQDKELVGWWVVGKRRLYFGADGNVLKQNTESEKPVARWWYNYPDDTFENATDVGGGGVLWLGSNELSTLRLETPEAKSLLLETSEKKTVFRKEEK